MQIITKEIKNEGGWSYLKVDVLDESNNDELIHSFTRDYPSLKGNTTFFEFYHNKERYVLVGEKYNSVRCYKYKDWENVTYVEGWSAHQCPLNYRQINNNIILMESMFWGGTGSFMSILDISELDKGIISQKSIEYPTDLDIYSFNDIIFEKVDDDYYLTVPLSWFGRLQMGKQI